MTVNRKLAPQEQLFEVTNRLNGSGNILIISYIQGYIEENFLRKAIALVQQSHPFLNSRIVGYLDSLRFEPEGTEPIPLFVMENCQVQQWQNIALEQINQAIESSKALGRIVLIRDQKSNTDNYLLITLHHGIADGISSVQLQSQLLDYYQKLASQQPIPLVTCFPEVPPVEEVVPEFIKKSLEENQSSGDVQLSESRDVETLDFETIVPRHSRRSGMIHRQFNQEFTQRLLNTCRQEKTTVHGALCAAMLLAVAKKISNNNQKEIQVSCTSAVNLRSLIQPEIRAESLGEIVANSTSFHSIKTGLLFWDLAREVKQKLQSSIESGEIFSAVLGMNMNSMMSRPNQGLTTVVVTNLGQVNIPKIYGSLKLEEIHFTAGMANFGGQLFCAVTTFQGKMFLNFPFSQPSLSPETMEILVEDALSYLTDASLGKKIIFEF